ncbi:MAG: hypothetical protein ACJA16_003541 [Akkermansiaceae bacterium]|jgi:hypothetical protein
MTSSSFRRIQRPSAKKLPRVLVRISPFPKNGMPLQRDRLRSWRRRSHLNLELGLKGRKDPQPDIFKLNRRAL